MIIVSFVTYIYQQYVNWSYKDVSKNEYISVNSKKKLGSSQFRGSATSNKEQFENVPS